RGQAKSVRAGLALFNGKALPIVSDCQHDPVGSVAQQNGHKSGTRVLSHVTEGLLRHTIQFVFSLFGEFVRPTAGAERAMNSAIMRKALGQLAQSVSQMSAFERLWSQSQQHSASVFQTAFGQLSCAGQILRDSLGLTRAFGRLQV